MAGARAVGVHEGFGFGLVETEEGEQLAGGGVMQRGPLVLEERISLGRGPGLLAHMT
jgi:hypothetical protein